ncbi:helix-turn-helix domain-containing protein [Streptomyces sp. QTS137]
MVERVPEATGAGRTEEFAALLRGLKDRSGLSYGTLAKRLHMSTSTLHRYCNGTAVPHEYAPVERLARVCRATPQELVELHRRWILADAARRDRPDRAATTAAEAARVARAETGAAETGAAGAENAGDTSADPAPADPAPAPDKADKADKAPAHEQRAGAEGGEPVFVDTPRGPAPSRRRRSALIASVAVAAVLGAAVLAVNLPSGGGGDHTDDRRAVGAGAAATGAADSTEPSAEDSASPSPSGGSGRPSASSSVAESATDSPGTSKNDGEKGDGEPTGGSGAVPLNVATRSYVYDSPCSQHFLVDSAPEQVGPPASEQDAPRWAAAYGAVSSGEQRVALTVQGTGRETVVLEALHVRVLTKGAPLAWNDYAMGVGCGGNVETKSFDVDLDDGSPTVTAGNGQRDFPYKVSESDPEVFYVTAHTEAHDVRWDLTLDWSSGSRRGTVHIDGDGAPFRTSTGTGRPGYDYPLGGSEWIEREG